VNTATASIHPTAMIAEADSSSHLTQYDNFLGDATVEKEGTGVCVYAAKSDPETEYKCKEPGMTSDVSNLATATSIQVPDAETVQLQDAEVGHRQNEVKAADYHREKGEVLQREMVNLQKLRDHDNNEITSLEGICDKREALGREMMELQYLKNEFKENYEDNEMISLEDSCEEHEVQGKEIVQLQTLGDDYTDERILEDPCKKCEAQGTGMIELQEDYDENELQDEVECTSSSVSVNKIISARKDMVNTRKALSEFLTDSSSKHTDTAETSEHVSHKMPSNGIIHSKCDNREQQEEAIEEEVNKEDTENMEKQKQMSVHAGNKEEAGKCSSAGQVKRYVNCSLELQLINQDNVNEPHSNV
jgi:hypothetical protein